MAIKEVIGEHQDPRVLDLGCGTGLFKKYFPACDYVGVDTNPKYIDYDRKKLHGQFILGDILELDTCGINTTFDYIILNGVLHHIDSATVAHLIKSVGRFLNRTGKIVVVDHIWHAGLNPINKFLLQFDRGSFSRTEAAYRALFEQFTVTSFKPFYIQAGSLVLWTEGRFVLACT